MNVDEQAHFDAVKRVGTFGTTNATDYTTPVPPALAVTTGQTNATQRFAELNTPNTGLIAQITKNAGTQQSGTGGFRGGTTSKGVLRGALMAEIKGLNKSAAAVAAAQKKPELMDSFRIPHGVSDEILTAKANAMAAAAGPWTADFVALGHDATFVNDFRDEVTTFDQADDTQNAGEQMQAGATAGFGPLLRSAMTKVKQLDAFMHNFYKNDANKMGQWYTASHVERTRKKKKPPTPPTP
ncbi:MAG: hypothetical protein ACR2HH_04400 [Chthoniobacterales bacterium]